MYRFENFAFRHNTQFAHSTVTNPSGGRRESGRLVGRTISEQTSLYKQADAPDDVTDARAVTGNDTPPPTTEERLALAELSLAAGNASYCIRA